MEQLPYSTLVPGEVAQECKISTHVRVKLEKPTPKLCQSVLQGVWSVDPDWILHGRVHEIQNICIYLLFTTNNRKSPSIYICSFVNQRRQNPITLETKIDWQFSAL